MEKNNNELMQVPYVVYESASTKSDRVISRLIGALIICIALLFTSNVLWLRAWSSYDYTATDASVSVDAGSGTANYIGEDGDINNGKNNSTQENGNKTQE